MCMKGSLYATATCSHTMWQPKYTAAYCVSPHESSAISSMNMTHTLLAQLWLALLHGSHDEVTSGCKTENTTHKSHTCARLNKQITLTIHRASTSTLCGARCDCLAGSSGKGCSCEYLTLHPAPSTLQGTYRQQADGSSEHRSGSQQ